MQIILPMQQDSDNSNTGGQKLEIRNGANRPQNVVFEINNPDRQFEIAWVELEAAYLALKREREIQ